MAYIERRLGAALRAKIESDDVLQEVSAEAVRAALPTIGASIASLSPGCARWPNGELSTRIATITAAKRDAGRELSINRAAPDESRAQVVDMLVASMTTASQVFSRNVRQERLSER